jgi:hypothetical protein
MIFHLKSFKKYALGSTHLALQYPRNLRLVQLINTYQDWEKSILDSNFSTLSQEIPWITFPAIRFLKAFLSKEMRVFEYGSGGSTIFFSQRVKEVVSVEHDPKWKSLVVESIDKKELKNCSIFLILPEESAHSKNDLDPEDIDSYKSTDGANLSKTFRDYASSIDKYPEEYFDLILIDGRARPSCFKHAVPKVKRRGGIIMLDNTDRDYYLKNIGNLVEGTKFLDFPGFVPGLITPSRTSGWKF